MTTTAPTRSPPHPTSSRQIRLREKAEEINLVLLEPDVNLWKLRELALSDGGLVNDTIRRRAWPKLVGLSSHNHNPDDIKVAAMASPSGPSRPNKKLRKGTAPDRVTNFGQDENQQGTVLTGGIFDQHDTAATTALQEDDNTSLASFDSMEPSEVVACIDAEQIERDVTRCTWHLLTGGQRSRRRVMLNKHRKKISQILRRKQRRLGDLINLTLAVSESEFPTNDRLCYFQGYHDVASIFLAALGGASTKNMDQQQQQQQQNQPSNTAASQAANMGLELSSQVLYRVSLSHFREPMRSNFLNLQTAMRMVLLPLVRVMDPELHGHLYACCMEPFFALSWLLTWFSHDIRDTLLVKRLFDFFLVSHPLMPIYLSVAMLCHPSNRKEILATPCEFAELHSVLQGLPKNSSMVGWKWSVGVDGYVSDDEQVGEDGETSISLDSDMTSHQSGGQNSVNRGHSLRSGNREKLRREDLILSEGQAHVVSMGIPAHVPFQELIDSAVSLMGRVPPRKLLGVATRYFYEQEMQPMLELYPSITFFHQPPSWALRATAKADWVLNQRARAGTTRDRRALTELSNRNNTGSGQTNTTTHDNNRTEKRDDSNEATCTPEETTKKAELLGWPKAMIAQGFGPGEDELARRNKRRKLLMIGGAATVAIFAIGLGVAVQYRGSSYPPMDPAPASELDFNVEREEAVSYVKSNRVPQAMGKRRMGNRSQPQPQCLESDAPGSALSSVDRGNESIIHYMFQKHVMRELQFIYDKLRLLMVTFSAIHNPNFTDNVQAAMSQAAHTVSATVSQAVATVQDPGFRSGFHKSVAKKATQATKYVGRVTGELFKFTASQARAHLGGNNFEELELL